MATNYVKIYYGPVESFNLSAQHRPQFLHGLRNRLLKLGYRVDLVPVRFINYCMLAICGYMVYQCNIRSFSFNTPHDLDPVCHNAVSAAVEATTKLNRARTYLWTWDLLHNQIFNRSELTSRDYWLENEDLKSIPPLASLLELKETKTASHTMLPEISALDFHMKQINAAYTDELERTVKGAHDHDI